MKGGDENRKTAKGKEEKVGKGGDSGEATERWSCMGWTGEAERQRRRETKEKRDKRKERVEQLVSGVDMFVGQAAVQFHHFTGEDPPIDLMREALKRSVGAAQY